MAQNSLAEPFIEEAQRQTGLERFDSDSWREGLDILLADMTRPGQPPMSEAFKYSVVLSLANRLKSTDYLARRPELLQRPIERPVFVMGATRTGTTLLNNLLAADPNRRSALTWEIDDPVPPPTSATLYTDPRALARLEAERARLAADPGAGKYYRGSAVYPNECIFWMRSDFKALIWESCGVLPAYRDWLFQTDVTSTYAYHKRFLQLLQADAPGVWNLKMPSHSLWLETLVKFYPDARLVWTHRDPFTSTGSFCSLISFSHNTFIGPGQDDKAWIAQDMPWQTVKHLDGPMNFRDAHGEDSIIDVHYAQLMREPIETMRKLYAALGDDFTPEAEASMRAWLADNPQDKYGRHKYKLDAYGLSVETLRPMFERYLSRYEVETEGF
jgi:hypothetical protein